MRPFKLTPALAAVLALLPLALAGRPAGVPDSYVATPFGYFHPSCVRRLAKGERLMAGGRSIRRADGSEEKLLPCDYARFSPRGVKLAPGKASSTGSAPAAGAPTISHDWVLSTITDTASSGLGYGGIGATWTVPSSPVSSDSQVLYFFPGLQGVDPPVESILQPVLGWDADFVNDWSIASWNCCLSDTATESDPVRVSPGDTIQGAVQPNCGPGNPTCPTWNITTDDLSTGQSTALTNSLSNGQVLGEAFSGAVEVYNVSQCSDYPSNGGITFTNVWLNDPNLVPYADPNWQMNISGNISSPAWVPCNYGGAANATQAFFYFSGPQLTASPASVTFGPGGGTQASTVQAVEPSGFNDQLFLQAFGLPAGVTAGFNPGTTNGSAVLTLSAAAGSSPGSFTATLTANSRGVLESCTIAITILGTPTPTYTRTATLTPTPTFTPTVTLVAATCGQGITVDGFPVETAWNGPSNLIPKLVVGSNPNNEQGAFKVRWNASYLYLSFFMTNASFIIPPSTSPWLGDAFELYLDVGNNRSTSYESDDFQFVFGYMAGQAWEKNGRTTGVLYQSQAIGGSDQYSAEAAIPWSTLGLSPAAGKLLGFDVGADLGQLGGRVGQMVWVGTSTDYTDTSHFGVLSLGAACATPSLSPSWTPGISATSTATPTLSASPTPSPTPSAAIHATATRTPSPSATMTSVGSPSDTPTATRTASTGPSPTASFTRGATFAASPTRSNSPAASSTATPSRTASPTASPSPATGCSPAAPLLLDARGLANGCYQASNSLSYAMPAGANTLLLLRLENGSGAAASAASYNGQPLALVRTDVDFSGGVLQTYMLASPPSGAHTLNVQYPAPNCSWNAAVEAYSGVNQAAPIGANAFTQDTDSCPPTSFSDTMAAQQADSLLSDFLAVDVLPPSITLGPGQSNFGFSTGCCDNIYGDRKTASSVGSASLSYTFSQCKRHSSELVEVRGIACGPAPRAPAGLPSDRLAPGKTPGPAQNQLAAYPNPAAGAAVTVAYQLSQAGAARVILYSLAGEAVASLDLGQRPVGPGVARLPLEATAPGIYLLELLADGGGGLRPVASFKLAVLR